MTKKTSIFTIVAHDYFITEQAIDELYIYMHREMRRVSLTNMKQPAPINGLMGMDTILIIKYKGQPCCNIKWALTKNNKKIQSGATDHNGMSFGLDVAYSNGICQCYPKFFHNYNNQNKPDLNKRCCKVLLPIYQLKVTKLN